MLKPKTKSLEIKERVMNHNKEHDKIREEFFKNYRGRYSSYWIERWGLIPELPTSFDNANSVYELLAWLQRAFKQLLDDFVALESELEDFKNAFTELLENLVPLLIRRYMASKEADDWFTEKADRYYQTIIKPYIDNEVRKLNERIAREVKALNDRIDREVKALNDRITSEVNRLDSEISTLQNQVNKINSEITSIKNMLNTLKFMSSGQPPYRTIMADYQNNAVISLIPNPSFPNNQGVGLKVANVQYETENMVNRTTWLQINLGELRFSNIKQNDVLGRVSIAKLLDAGLQQSMIDGIERFNRLIAGITVDQRPVELVLSKEGDMIKISYVGGFMQSASETISGLPRTENSSTWVQIIETPK